MQQWNVPFDELEFKTSLGTTHVTVCGPENASSLVLLHGLNASSTMWYPNVADFAAHYRVYAIDFIMEPGKSRPLKGMVSKDDIVKWYREIFDHFSLHKVSIVGASRGGWLATQIAISLPSYVDKIVLLSPAQALTPIKLKKKVIDNIVFALFPKHADIHEVLNTLSVNVNQLDPAYVNQFCIASRYAKINKSLFQMTPFTDKELKSLKLPVMILIGDHDIINNKKSLERAEENIPDVTTQVISDAGHFISFDRPVLIDKKILDFLTETSSQK